MKNAILMIIDMQQGMSWPQAGDRNNPKAEATIAALLDHWRTHLGKVVHVHHHSTEPDSLFWPHQKGAKVQTAFLPLENEKCIVKSVPDAFTYSDLADWFKEQKAEAVVIVGVSTNNSVESTVRSAGNLGFPTYVVESGCFAFAKQDFDGCEHTAQEVHAMSLANLQGEYAEVISMEEAMALLS